MNPKRIAAALAGAVTTALAAVIVVAMVARHHGGRHPVKQKFDVAPGTLLRARDFNWTQMKGSREQWRLRAEEASYSEDKTSLTLKGSELSMVLEDGKSLTLRAAKAQLRLNGRHVDQAELSGGVELDYGDVALNTAEAVFQPDRDELRAPGLVQVRSPGFRITGVGLEAHPRARLFELQHQVNTRFMKRPDGAGSSKS